MSPSHSSCLKRIESDPDVLAKRLTRLAEINSGSFNAEGVNRVGSAVQALLAPLGAETERLAVAPLETWDADGAVQRCRLGTALRLRKRAQAPLQILLCAHLDTVFAADHPFQQVARATRDALHGPGVADMKGGILVMAEALGALESSPARERLGWEVLLVPDEEIGSPGSAPLLGAAAARHHAGLVFEPAMPDGVLAYRRRGSGNFTVISRGRSAHAGREHHLGRNAIRALADFVSAIDDLNGHRDGVTVNPGFIHGGGAVNVVPDTAVLKFNVRVDSDADIAWVEGHLHRLLLDMNTRDGIAMTLHGGFGRPPKPLSAVNQALFAQLRDAGSELGLTVQWRDTGGCSDGNNLAAAGLPNIDTLGAVGSAIHSADERVSLSSITERARLTALLMLRWASGEVAMPASEHTHTGERLSC